MRLELSENEPADFLADTIIDYISYPYLLQFEYCLALGLFKAAILFALDYSKTICILDFFNSLLSLSLSLGLKSTLAINKLFQ